MAETSQVVRTALELFRTGKFDQAGEMLRRALSKDARHPGANQLYALTLLALHRPEPALFAIQRAIEAEPRHAEFQAILGMIRVSAKDRAGAEAAFRRALELDPAHVAAAAQLGHLLQDRGAHDEAEAILRTAQRADPASPQIACSLARVVAGMGRPDEAAADLNRDLKHALSAGQLTEEGPVSLLCLLTNYVESDPAAVLEVHRNFGRMVRAVIPATERKGPEAFAVAPLQGRRLRIGYLSPDLCRHSVAAFLEPILESHDRTRFEVFAYSVGAKVDEVTRRMESLVEHWRGLGPVQDGPVLETIRRDRLDVLVELSGHTLNSRLMVLARRGAPVQASFLGYPATTGSPGIDVRLVDSITDPPGAEAFATERLVRLARCFVCFKPPGEAPEPGARPDRPVTFGSFNNPAKLSDATVELWARVLIANPGSRLVLKGSGLGLKSVQDRLAARFSERAIERSRIDVLDMIADPRGHLAAYDRIDIGLDPAPYNGTTTTCEALWMGVPVVTLRGRTHAARVGASLMEAAGLPELVAATPEAYVECATALARDGARLAELRASLRHRLAASALCDRAAYTREFERVLEGLAARPA